MGRSKEDILKDLLDLEPAERAEVAEDALRSLDGTGYGELSPAREEEIQRRLRAMENGSADLVDGDDVFKEIKAELLARRPKGE